MRRMPWAVYVLGLSILALGTSEFMLAGLLEPIADDMGVSIPRAGLLISAFAIGMVVGAPLLAAATLHLPRRTTLISLIAIFGLGQVTGALAPSYWVLFGSRVISALACAGVWAVGAAVAVAVVPYESRARALAVMLGGLSIANVIGVPAGAFLGGHAGWRAAFWAVAALSAVALCGVLAFVPHTGGDLQKPSLRRELRIYRESSVWLSVAVIALFAAGTFCAFSYLAPLLTKVAKLDDSWVPLTLALYGFGALIGSGVGGRFADARLLATIYGGTAATGTVLAAVAITAENAVAVAVLSFVLGLASFITAPALNAHMFHIAHPAPTLAGATATAAFNVGNTAGPWIGGVVISAGFGYRNVAWAGAALLVCAVAVTGLARALGKHGAVGDPRAEEASVEPTVSK